MYEYDEELLKLIPPGFCIEKYEKSKACSALSWQQNINIRASVDDCLQNLESIYLKSNKGWDGNTVGDTLQDYIKLNEENIDRGFVLYDPHSAIIEVNKKTVEPLTLPVAISIQEQVDEALDKGDRHAEISPYEDMILSCPVVDIWAPDKLVLEHFKDWLKSERLKRDLPAEFTKNNLISPATFRKWYGKRVIAYLDITQWHALRDIKLKKHQLGKILFPDEINRREARNEAEIINKSTEKFAKEVLSPKIQYALLMQVIYEKRKDL